uniref:Uncharacterized protein n=1 Tax=Panagrolaimus superbus TaxID=310955 RepID=A0A914YEJ8_9BILA
MTFFRTDNNNIDSQQGNTDMDEEDDDDVTIIVKTETDDIDDEESKTLGFAENKCDVIILESDTEEEEENVAFFEEEESSEERDENDDDEIIVLDSDSEDDFEESSENIQSLKDEEELKNDENSNFGYIDNDLEDDVILRIKPEINDDDGDCKYEAEEEENKEQIETSAIVDEIKKPDDFPMFQFLKFIKDVNAHKKDKLLKLKGRPDIVKIAASIPELDKHRDFYMSPGFNTNFNNLFKTAARRKNIYLDHVTTIINRYLTDGESVEYFDGFPKAPSRPINMYISEKADGEQNNIQTIARKRKSFSSGEIDRKPYFEKYVNESKEYIKKIEQYLHQERKNLCESHVVHIQNLISKKEKEIEKAALGESEPVPSRKKSKRQIKTAFDYFKDANPNLYSDYETERRNSKLLKKFNRLEDNVKQIYENIAARNA